MHSTVRTYNLLFSLFKENKISKISNYGVGGVPTVTGGLSFSVTIWQGLAQCLPAAQPSD